MKKLVVLFLISVFISVNFLLSQDEPSNADVCKQWDGGCNTTGDISRMGNVNIGTAVTTLFPVKLGVSADNSGSYSIKTLGGVSFSANGSNLPALSVSNVNPGGLAGSFFGDVEIIGSTKMVGNSQIVGDLAITESLDVDRINISDIGYAKAFKVQLPPFPPDYVFASDYDLMPLNELEKYLKENKHLPNIPSAKEMEEEGELDLGEFQFKQLEKIEELTLYIIDINNRLEKIESENQLLKEKNDLLKDRLKEEEK